MLAAARREAAAKREPKLKLASKPKRSVYPNAMHCVDRECCSEGGRASTIVGVARRDGTVRRTRECQRCGQQFQTVELPLEYAVGRLRASRKLARLDAQCRKCARAVNMLEDVLRSLKAS